jgi:hypothetical protein
MVIHFREAQILEREVTQALKRIINWDLSVSHTLKKVLQLPGVHRLTQAPRRKHLLKW